MGSALRLRVLTCALTAVALGAAPSGRTVVAWEDLAGTPVKYLGESVQVPVQFESWQEDWNPYLTRFGHEDFRMLVGWSGAQFPWEQASFENPAVRVFVRRGGAAERVLAKAVRHESWELTGRVREVFGGLPWIEIERAVPLPGQITEGCVLHAARAQDLMEREAWERALEELKRALAGDELPEAARERLMELRGECEAHLADD